jgi:hypothetical protein
MITDLERLKRDYKETISYKRRLSRKGKDLLAYKLEKKALGLRHHIKELQILGG